jgi:hypothetical protein
MSLEIKGKLIKKLKVVNGESAKGKWTKQDFIIETFDNFPRNICITAWGNLISELDKIQPDDEVNVFVDVESREFKGNWYTNVKAWRIVRTEKEKDFLKDINDSQPEDVDDEGLKDLPF